MNPSFENSFDKMLQGLAYWLAYQNVILGCDIIESDAVKEAYTFLRTHLISGFSIKREYPLKLFSTNFGKRRSDLAIINKKDGKCCCLIEFKLADATNGGYPDDVEKLYTIKKKFQEIECYVIVLCRHSCKIDQPKKLVTSLGRAVGETKCIKNNIPIHVHMVRKAFKSLRKNPNMYKTILIEVLR